MGREADLYPREILRAEQAGFCGGVAKATRKAYQLIEEWPQRSKRAEGSAALVMLGELIHNRQVVDDLCARGMLLCHIIEEVPDHSTVLIRAHGIPEQDILRLQDKACVVENATCPYVTKIQELAHQAAENGKNIILTGDPQHPEVVGINAACNNQALIFDNLTAMLNYDFAPGKYVLLSQTTFSQQVFAEICDFLVKKIASLEIFATICSATENRQNAARRLAGQVDVMLVIGSRQSSNTTKLLDVCRGVCGENYLVENPAFVRALLVDGRLRGKRVGVSAGASSPESIIREVIHIMSENEAMNNQQEMGDVSFTDAIDSIPQLKRGATVKGVIVRYDNEFVYVDVHDKSEGRIPLNEFSNNPDFNLDEAVENHEEIDVFVKSIRNTDMGKEIILSKAKVDFAKYKTLVEEAYSEKEPIVVKVVNVVKDGVIATYGGIDIYIHRTQLDLGPVEDLEPYRDQELEILVTQFDPEKRRLRVSGSRRALLNRDRKKKAEELWSTIEMGDVYEGFVRSLTDFGAFVDIGGVDGLVHISELSWKRIKHPSEVVKVGDMVQVYIKDFDADSKRIKLGYKRIEDDPYHNVEERFPVGSIVQGKVMRMVNYGVFIEIADGVDAFCHISQISSSRLNRPDDVLTENMEVEARVIDVKNGEHRIGISIKEVAPIDTRLEPAENKAKQAVSEEELPTSYTDENQGSTVADTVAAAPAAEEIQPEVKVEAELPVEEIAAEEAVAEEAAAETVMEEAVAEEAAVETVVEEAVAEEAAVETVVEEAVAEAVVMEESATAENMEE